MQVIRNLLRANPQLIKNAVQRRNMSAIAVPAREKVSTAETAILGAMMFASWLFTPAWVLLHLKKYRTKE